MAGMHAPPGLLKPAPPVSLVNRLSVGGFNRLYYHLPRPARGITPYQLFFYPLDHLLNWNRLYGRRGFFQYQCVIPAAAGEELREILARIAASGQGSMLAVLKRFGEQTSGGLLSFPGVTLALDFPPVFGGGSWPTERIFMRNILIIGATSAIAEATARRFAASGIRFYLVGRNTEKLVAIARDLEVRSGQPVCQENLERSALGTA